MIRSILARIISVRMEESQVKRKIRGAGGEMDLISRRYGKGPGILWIHGGGYVLGMAEMVYYSMGRMLARICEIAQDLWLTSNPLISAPSQ